MKRTTLGQGGLDISAWCLGTMTYGNQTAEADAHQQMDMALDAGISFWDCAEMYPVAPVAAETVGNSERILGTWLASRGRRNEVQIATKVSGPNGGFIRDGKGFNADIIREAVAGSLERLQTSYIDLYQLHWPVRGSYHFRQYWEFDPSNQDKTKTLEHMASVLEVLKELQDDGVIRAFGLSNETAWGLARWCDVADQQGAPRVASMQNEYSLMCRLYDTDLAEAALNEGTTLLAYSPLATGMLTGKYLSGEIPAESRMARVPDLGSRVTPRANTATQAYLDLAEKHGIDPVHMALAFVSQRPFHAVPIFGATSTPQLERIIAGKDVVLSDELLAEINQVHRDHAMPF